MLPFLLASVALIAAFAENTRRIIVGRLGQCGNCLVTLVVPFLASVLADKTGRLCLVAGPSMGLLPPSLCICSLDHLVNPSAVCPPSHRSFSLSASFAHLMRGGSLWIGWRTPWPLAVLVNAREREREREERWRRGLPHRIEKKGMAKDKRLFPFFRNPVS